MIEPRFLRADFEQRRLCSIGSAILGAVGIAGAIGETATAIAGPLLTAGISAGVGAATGNDPLKSAIIGGGAGALGSAAGFSGDAAAFGGDLFGGSAGIAGTGDAATTNLLNAPIDVSPNYDLAGSYAGMGPSTDAITGAPNLPGGGGGDFGAAPTLDDSGATGLGKSLDNTTSLTGAAKGTVGDEALKTASTDKGLAKLLGKGNSNLPLLLGAAGVLGQSLGGTPQQMPISSVQGPLNQARTAMQPSVFNSALPMNYAPPRQVQTPDGFNPYQAGFMPTPDFFTNNHVAYPTLPAARGGSIGGALNRFAEGGAEFSTKLGQHYVQGPGDGQSDDIPAQLSDGEYVLTAHDVAVLGGGSNKAGAQRLDQWREHLHRSIGGDKFIPQKAKGALNQLKPQMAEAR